MKYIISVVLICLIAFTFGFKKNQFNNKEYILKVSTQVIRVSLDSLGTGLILDDGNNKGPNVTTKVFKKEIVKWKLVNNSGIQSLDSIKLKAGTDLFSIKPTKQSDGDLFGTIGDFPVGTEEEYGIYFTVNGVSYMHDPKIQVH